MILRKASKLKEGDEVFMHHPRYSKREFTVVEVVKGTVNSRYTIRVKTKERDSEFGPTIFLSPNDLIQIIPQ